MSKMPWIVGGGALAAYLFMRNNTARGAISLLSSASFVGPLPGRWVWPVQAWKGRQPVISDGFYSPRAGRPRHGGVDIMFKRLPVDSFKAGTPNGTKAFVMPDDIAVVAASDGVVWSAMRTPRGHAVVIDHSPLKVATFYAHLDKLLVTPTGRAASKQRVRAGQILGTVGFSPLDGEKIRHLHFEIWLGGPSDGIDPSPVMNAWPVVGDPRQVMVARNAGFTFRAVGDSGASPQWVRDLKDKAGVYVIRDADTHEVLYVGSSAGRLYDTLVTSRRGAGGRDSGRASTAKAIRASPTTAIPSRSVRLTSASASLDEEMRLIRRLNPRDNLIGQADHVADEVPF